MWSVIERQAQPSLTVPWFQVAVHHAAVVHVVERAAYLRTVMVRARFRVRARCSFQGTIRGTGRGRITLAAQVQGASKTENQGQVTRVDAQA